MQSDDEDTDIQQDNDEEPIASSKIRKTKNKKQRKTQPINIDEIFSKIKCNISNEVLLSAITSIIETIRKEDFKKSFNYFHGETKYKLQKKGAYPTELPDDVDKFLKEHYGGEGKLKYISGNEFKKNLNYTLTYIYNEMYWSITKLYYIRNELLYMRNDCKFLMELLEKEDYQNIASIILIWKEKMIQFLARIERSVNISINKDDIDTITKSTDLTSRKNTLYLIINKLEKLSAEQNWRDINIKSPTQIILIPSSKDSDLRYPTEISLFELMEIAYERQEGLNSFKNHSSYPDFKNKFNKLSQDFQIDISKQFIDQIKEEYEIDNKYIRIDNAVYTKIGDIFANFVFYLARECLNYAMNFNTGGSGVALSIMNIKSAFASIHGIDEYTSMNMGMQNILHYINISVIS